MTLQAQVAAEPLQVAVCSAAGHLVRAAPCGGHAKQRPTAHLWPAAPRPCILTSACIGTSVTCHDGGNDGDGAAEGGEGPRQPGEAAGAPSPLRTAAKQFHSDAGRRQMPRARRRAPCSWGLQTRCPRGRAPHLPIPRNHHDMGLEPDCGPSRGAGRALERPACRRPLAVGPTPASPCQGWHCLLAQSIDPNPPHPTSRSRWASRRRWRAWRRRPQRRRLPVPRWPRPASARCTRLRQVCCLPFAVGCCRCMWDGVRCDPEVNVASCCSCCLSSLAAAWCRQIILLTAALRPSHAPQIEVRRSGRLQGDKPQYNEDDLFAKELGIDR